MERGWELAICKYVGILRTIGITLPLFFKPTVNVFMLLDWQNCVFSPCITTHEHITQKLDREGPQAQKCQPARVHFAPLPFSTFHYMKATHLCFVYVPHVRISYYLDLHVSYSRRTRRKLLQKESIYKDSKEHN